MKMIKGILATGILIFCSACSTIVPLADPGTTEATSGSSEKNQALVVMHYDFNVNGVAKDYPHIIYLYDSDKHRYDIHVPAGYSTLQGVAFYLPADKEYALVGMFISRIHGTDFLFGKDLDLFKLKKDAANVLPLFVLREIPNTNYFVGLQKDFPADWDFGRMKSRYKNIEKVSQIKVTLFEKP